MSLTYSTLVAFVVVLLASPTVRAETFRQSDIYVPAGETHSVTCTTGAVNIVSLVTAGHGASDDVFVSFCFQSRIPKTGEM